MSSESERGTARAMKGGPPNPGVMVFFGEKAERKARFPTMEVALEQAERQRAGTEPVAFYAGADYSTKLAQGAKPRLEVGKGKSFKEALQDARQAG